MRDYIIYVSALCLCRMFSWLSLCFVTTVSRHERDWIFDLAWPGKMNGTGFRNTLTVMIYVKRWCSYCRPLCIRSSVSCVSTVINYSCKLCISLVTGTSVLSSVVGVIYVEPLLPLHVGPCVFYQCLDYSFTVVNYTCNFYNIGRGSNFVAENSLIKNPRLRSNFLLWKVSKKSAV